MCNNPNLELNFFESKNESVIKRLLNITEFVDDKLERLYNNRDNAYMWVQGLENRAFGGFLRLIGPDVDSASYKAFILPKVHKLSFTRHGKAPEIVSNKIINDIEIEGENDELTIYSKNADGNIDKILYKLCANKIQEGKDELPDPSDEITECDIPSNENNRSNENNSSESLYDKLKNAISSLTEKQTVPPTPVNNTSNEITLNDQQLAENNLVRKSELDNIKRDYTELQDKQTQLENEHDKLRKEFDELMSEHSQLVQDNDKLIIKNDELKEEHSNILAKLEEVSKKVESEVQVEEAEEIVPEVIEQEEPSVAPVAQEPIQAPIEPQPPAVEEPIITPPSEPAVENAPRTVPAPVVPVEPVRQPEPVVAEPVGVPAAPAPIAPPQIERQPENMGEQTEFDIESRIYGSPQIPTQEKELTEEEIERRIAGEQPMTIQPQEAQQQQLQPQPLAGGHGNQHERVIANHFSVGGHILTGGGRKRSRRLLRRDSLKKKSRRNRRRQ